MNKMTQSQMTRDDVTEAALRAKRQSGRSWAEIAEAIGMSPVWTHSAATGMQAMPAEKAAALAAELGLPDAAVGVLQECPTKTWSREIPTDPCIYRFYEIAGVYGPTLKALINEEFGDGIMSAIDFDMHVSRVADPKGDRVRVEMTGKFLAYNAW